jgi:hypothetical protein
MKKVSTAAVKATKKVSQHKRTIGLDLGDRSSVLGEGSLWIAARR